MADTPSRRRRREGPRARGGPCWMRSLVLPETVVNIRVPAAMRACLLPSALALSLGLAGAACSRAPDPQSNDKPAAGAGPTAPPQSAEELRAPLAKIDDVTITLG